MLDSRPESAPLILTTSRLRLRHHRADDIPFLVALWMDPEATRFMGGPRERAQLEEIFAETAANPTAERYDLWLVEELATGQLAGHCGLLDKEVEGRAEIELVYVLTPAAWGQGYATEMATALVEHAFTRLGLTRLIALIAPENAASERVAIKVGIRLEREIVRPGGALRRLYSVEKEAGAA